MSQRDYYEILNVDRNVDKNTIKKAYRKLAMKYHPDQNPDDKQAEHKFREAAEAYEILSDDNKRQLYDRYGHAGVSGQTQGFSNYEDVFSSFGDIFSDFFGGGGRSSSRSTGARSGSDLRYRTEMTLKEVITGTEQEIEFDTEGECSTCLGSGAKKGTSPETCSHCKGSGQVVRAQGFFSMASTCPICRGKGQVIKEPCKTCKGKGMERQHRKLKIDIPKGVRTGTQLRVNGEGEGGRQGGPSGDLYVEIIVQEDERFERQEEDLLTRTSISYLQAILGGTIEVENVMGVETLQIPPGTQSGETLKIPLAGLPPLRGSRKGDLFCQIQVEIPHRVNKQEKDLLKQLAEIGQVKISSSSSKSFFKL